MSKAYTRVNVDRARSVMPYWFYHRETVSDTEHYVRFKLASGFRYFLRNVTANWPEEVLVPPVPALPTVTAQLRFEFLDRALHTQRQNASVPADLFASPVGQQHVSLDPAPPVVGAVDFVAANRGSRKILNTLTAADDQIEVRVTGQQFALAAWWPTHFEIVLEGYYIPDLTKPTWGMLGGKP